MLTWLITGHNKAGIKTGGKYWLFIPKETERELGLKWSPEGHLLLMRNKTNTHMMHVKYHDVASSQLSGHLLEMFLV